MSNLTKYEMETVVNYYRAAEQTDIGEHAYISRLMRSKRGFIVPMIKLQS